MKIASITEAKNSLSALIDGLRAGSPVLIVDRGRPVARLEPVTGSAQDEPDGGDCRGCSATGWHGRVAAIHHGRCSVAGCPTLALAPQWSMR
ncbi:MAG: type II toxin-antitoxin system Phd/YefM family antitoxin [Acetobacteraceae bacterium]|jgi:prevent-host-death family protein